MADTREIRIYIEGNATQATQKIPSAQNADMASMKASNAHTASEALSSTTSSVGMAAAKIAFDYMKSIASEELPYELSKAITMSDDYVAARRISATASVVSKGASVAQALSTAFAAGGLIGLGIATIGESAMLGIEIYQNYDKQSIALRKQDAQLDYLRQRAGYSLTSGSIGEDK